MALDTSKLRSFLLAFEGDLDFKIQKLAEMAALPSENKERFLEIISQLQTIKVHSAKAREETLKITRRY